MSIRLECRYRGASTSPRQRRGRARSNGLLKIPGISHADAASTRRSQQHQLLVIVPADQFEVGFVADEGGAHLHDLEQEGVDLE